MVAAADERRASSPAQGSGAEPERSTFVDSSFVGLPKPAGAQSFGAATFEGGTWVQSYEVDGLDPLQTVAFYENRLDTDWVESPPLRRLGQCLAHGDTPETQCTYRGLWVSGDERLEVVAGPAGPGGTDGRAVDRAQPPARGRTVKRVRATGEPAVPSVGG